ncbi:uncharacterized protein LOC143671576 isoform X2 [Tamandua tetradactyla]|uniref:uncharacterized protein LOC143671576 isoform X2 n=1 Tax=Tamandua tetradactyla TaxID=48850 RepID=UPI004053C866
MPDLEGEAQAKKLCESFTFAVAADASTPEECRDGKKDKEGTGPLGRQAEGQGQQSFNAHLHYPSSLGRIGVVLYWYCYPDCQLQLYCGPVRGDQRVVEVPIVNHMEFLRDEELEERLEKSRKQLAEEETKMTDKGKEDKEKMIKCTVYCI